MASLLDSRDKNIQSNRTSILQLFIYIFKIHASTCSRTRLPMQHSLNSTPQTATLNRSFHLTQVICPSTPTPATLLPINPLLTFRASTTTSPLSCKPTATKSPTAFSENWRGKLPPAGASWTKDNVPSTFRRKVERESEGMRVLFFGSGFGRWKEVLLRFEIMRYLLSGYGMLVTGCFTGFVASVEWEK